jgi:hypothetical protein
MQFQVPAANGLLQQQMAAMAQAQMAQVMAGVQAAQAQGQNSVSQGSNQTATPASGAGTSDGRTFTPQGHTDNDALARRPSSTEPRLESETGAPTLPPGTRRTVRHEALGPNGERWTMTINSGNITIPVPTSGPQPFQNIVRPFARPPHLHVPQGGFGANSPVERDLQRVQLSLENAQREIENVRILLQAVNGDQRPLAWRQDEIRRRLESVTLNLDQMQTGLSSLASDPSIARNRTVLSLQMLGNNLRTETGNLVDFIDQRLRSVSPNPPSSGMPTPSSTTTSGHPQGQAQNEASNPLSVLGPELFILSSPQGPVGILFDERGTYRTAPFATTSPFSSFNQQFATNREVLAAVGQQMAQLQDQATMANAAQGQPAPNLAQGAVPAAPAAAEPAVLQVGQPDRLNQLWNHVWLALKLLVFLYFFAGGGSWYRPAMMGLIGAVAYLAQLGVFDGYLERVRRHFEALVGLNDRAPNAGQQQAQENPSAANREPTPAETAQRMVQQRQERNATWFRERMRTIERAFALFVASLWPGLGERMVQAQEERVRAARAAEEERKRAEEEQAAREQEEREKESQEKADAATPVAERESSFKGKGKERAVEPEEAGPSSAV